MEMQRPIPNSLIKRLNEGLDAMYYNPAICKHLDEGNFIQKEFDEYILDPINLGASVCTYCKLVELYIDILFTNSVKTDWQKTLRVTYRCSKLLGQFAVAYWSLGTKHEYPAPCDYRCVCPHIDLVAD